MEDFPGLLASNYGLRAGGKAAPMAASKGNYGIGSSETRSNSLNRGKSNWNSTPVGNNSSFLDDDNLFRSSNSSSNQRNNNEFDGLGGFNDVYGAPPKHSGNNNARKTTNLDYDSMFQGINDSNSGAKTSNLNSSLPVYDKPVYDDDIFDGVPGMKSTASVNYDDVFATSSSSPPQQKDRKHTASYDDVFSSFTSPPRRKETSVRNTDDLFTSTSLPVKEKDQFDDLLGNLGRRNTPESRSSTRKGPEVRSRDTSDFDDLLPGFNDRSPAKNRGTPETSHPRQSTVPSNKSTSMSDEPFVIIEPGSVPAHESSEIFRDPLEQFNKADNPDSSYINNSAGGGVFNSMNSFDDFAKSIPSFPSSTKGKMDDTHSLRTGAKTTSTRRAAVEEPAEEPFFRAAKSSSPKVEASPMSEVNVDSAADIWITVSEVPLFTQPTRAPPPSRPPPPRPVQVSKVDDGSRHARNVREKSNEYSSHYSSPGYQSPPAVPSSGSTMGMSSADELEDFARAKEHTDDRPDVLSSEEEVDTNSAAAAMKEAMDRAEAKFKQAREVRERENVRTGRNRDQEKDEKASRDAQERELRERQERLDREREQREKEEKRLDRERREKEREQTRHVVERAQREARERAAMEARQKAQKVAVEKATAEARERAERAAVQRAQNEARERAAAGAKERAEKAAKEAKERAAAEKAASEARERATEARVRATRENQQRNENDLENIFGRPSSTPKPRATTPDFPFDAQPQNRPAPAPGRTSSNPIRKASSTTNIVDDLTSIFGGSPSSGDFPDIDGETEERRRARMERHQRTQERAAKALAEKNERDLQVQRDQAERNRIGESLDIEIKRWSAGKEGNLRALLSTMQYVLWPECGWQPVSLTDLITGASVKKVYRKATLCIHPDKVQQKGANLQQKYIAEKVFDLLKEAWNKFNSEELF